MWYIVGLAIMFILMLLAPFIGAILYCKNKKGNILQIYQEKIKDARYFGKSFAQNVEKNISLEENGVIMLSKEEEFLNGDIEEVSSEEVEKLVICLKKDFEFSGKVKRFRKEIYGATNIINRHKNVRIRAAYAGKSMLLAENTMVERWVDAEETLAIYDGCQLGMSASAGQRMSVGKECRFRRLYAPEILIGQYPQKYRDAMDGRKSFILETTEKTDIIRDIRYVEKEMANERCEVNASILTRYDLVVLEDMIVRGDIRTQKKVRICDGAVIGGNVFAEEDIHIGKNAVVLGNVFTQGSIYVESGAMLGQPGKICSVIAREKIVFERDISVFGYVSCEHGGKVVSGSNEYKAAGYCLLHPPVYRTEVFFDDLEAYERADKQGYRKDEHLKRVEIGGEAKEVFASMFFLCKSLEKVVLPRTLERIGDYAFADCVSLEDVTDLSMLNLKSIGTSAFENCVKLEKIKFPRGLENLGGAAFGGCTGLKEITFFENARLETIGAHCFRGCKQLERIGLPNTVKTIGISAFRGCEALKFVSIPASCESQPGILELQKRGDVQIFIRDTETRNKDERI